MKKHITYSHILQILLDILSICSAFLLARALRDITDLIPRVQLPVPYISLQDFLPFIALGVFLYIGIFSIRGMYRRSTYILDIPYSDIVSSACMWFVFYIGIVYLSLDFIFAVDIPRLIIFFTLIFATLFSLFHRSIYRQIYISLVHSGYISRQKIIIYAQNPTEDNIAYTSIGADIVYTTDIPHIVSQIRTHAVDRVVYSGPYTQQIRDMQYIAKVYGIEFSIRMDDTNGYIMPHTIGSIGNVPTIDFFSVGITLEERIIKRLFDICVSSILLIILTPLYILVAVCIYATDSTGPIIYRNRRVGKNGELFDLYKFRYMYWKYCTKEAYSIEDDALDIEKKLISTSNTRTGPLYKIANDPRKMPIGKLIEMLSIDELPQLYNVLKGDMSLVGPRPHQPREVEQYLEHQRQVLTVRPGITGKAQVCGRDANTFDHEATLDIMYIENYTIWQDIVILFQTALLVVSRPYTQYMKNRK